MSYTFKKLAKVASDRLSNLIQSNIEKVFISIQEQFNSISDALDARPDISGTPVDNQIAVWTDADTLEGDANLTYDSSSNTLALDKDADAGVFFSITNQDTGSSAFAGSYWVSESAGLFSHAYSSTKSGSWFGITMANMADIISYGSDNFCIGTFDAKPMHFGTNNVARLTVTSAGNVGIGTPTAPLNGVGIAKLAIDGTANPSTTGPNVQFTISATDNHPLMQFLPWAHDNINLNFDAYYNNSNWKSSDAGSNFQIRKQGDCLRFRYDSGVAAGSNMTWNEGMVLDTNGRLGIGESSPLTKLHVVDDTQSLDSGDIFNVQLLVEDGDAGICIASNYSGTWGSRLCLSDHNGATFNNTWGMVRQTSNTGNNALHFTYGTDVNVINNTDVLVLSSDGKVGIGGTATAEQLEVDGAIKIGTAAGTDNGTIRWTGSDFEGRKGGSWESLTGAGVTVSGTPVDNQLGVWTAADALEGDPKLTFNSSTNTLYLTDDTDNYVYAIVESDNTGSSAFAGLQVKSHSACLYLHSFSSNYAGTYFGVNRTNMSDIVTLDSDCLAIGTLDSNPMYFGTNDVTRMTILSGGKIGMGEDTPLGNLHIKTADAGSVSVPALADELILENSGACGMSFWSGTTSTGNIYFGSSADEKAGRVVYSHASDTMSFYCNSALTAVITSDGELGIGISPLDPLHVENSDPILRLSDTDGGYAKISGAGGNLSYQADVSGAVGSSYHSWAIDNSTKMTLNASAQLGIGRSPTTYALEVNGDAGKTSAGNTWNIISDRTLKKDIVPLIDNEGRDSDGHTALDRITKLRGVLYRWIKPEEHGLPEGDDRLLQGLIAQEVEEHFPEWVTTDAKGKKWLNLIGFEAYIIEALKVIKSDLVDHETRISKLEQNRDKQCHCKNKTTY